MTWNWSWLSHLGPIRCSRGSSLILRISQFVDKKSFWHASSKKYLTRRLRAQWCLTSASTSSMTDLCIICRLMTSRKSMTSSRPRCGPLSSCTKTHSVSLVYTPRMPKPWFSNPDKIAWKVKLTIDNGRHRGTDAEEHAAIDGSMVTGLSWIKV